MQINHNDFVGKTIKSMDTLAVNEVVFHFTDGTKVALETVCELPSLGLYGIAQVSPSLEFSDCEVPGCEGPGGPACTHW